MIKKLTLVTILLLGNIAFSQEPKLTSKYLFATLKGKIDDRYDITMNIRIYDDVRYSWTGENVSGYYYDIFEKNIYFHGYIDKILWLLKRKETKFLLSNGMKILGRKFWN